MIDYSISVPACRRSSIAAVEPHPAQGFHHLDIANLLVCMASDLLEKLPFRRDGFFEGAFEVGLGRGGV